MLCEYRRFLNSKQTYAPSVLEAGLNSHAGEYTVVVRQPDGPQEYSSIAGLIKAIPNVDWVYSGIIKFQTPAFRQYTLGWLPGEEPEESSITCAFYRECESPSDVDSFRNDCEAIIDLWRQALKAGDYEFEEDGFDSLEHNKKQLEAIAA